jgi:hypothetical protein
VAPSTGLLSCALLGETMSVRADSFVMGSPPEFDVDVGFQPRWVIVMMSNRDTEDVWASQPSMGIGWAALRNSALDVSGAETSLRNGQISEIWTTNQAASAFLGNLVAWIRANTGNSGWAAFIPSLHDNGFTVRYSEGYSSGGPGKRAYYIAGDVDYEEVGATLPFVPGSPYYELGWLPMAFFGVGSGGGVSAPGGLQNIGWTDMSTPAVVAGDWDEHQEQNLDMNVVWRGILDPNVDVQSWYGNFSEVSTGVIVEATQSVGVQFTSDYNMQRTDTAFKANVVDTGGFSQGQARMHTFMLGSVDSMVGSFIPSMTVGVPTQVVLPFQPEAVIFFSPQEHKSGVFNATTQGATGWGWCTEEDQALIIYGGHWNPPVAFQSAGMISSSKCWVGNCLQEGVSGTVGTQVNAGSAQINPLGFTHTTTENATSVVYPVHFWAIAPQVEHADMWMMEV